jgi:FkbM family methyltransferase
MLASLPLARARDGSSGRVIALEADAWLVQLLRRSALLPSAYRADIEILPAAVSDSVDVVNFNVAMRSRASNAIGTTQTGGFRDRHAVISITLDWLLVRRPAPGILKIDVKGAEARVAGRW